MNLFCFIKQKVDILDLVGEYVTLKRAGVYWKGHCPFHIEKTASFTVSPSLAIFYCFGCNAGGDAIAFISKLENCTQLQAAKLLAEKYNINVPQEYLETKESPDDRKKYYDCCSLFAKFCQINLSKELNAKKYILERGISEESIKQFEIGYCPSKLNVQGLLSAASKVNLIAKDFIESNILIESHTGIYFAFEERIIFPIKDSLGRICGFGGRIFKNAENKAKYFNSHDHNLFNKSATLFGLDKAKKPIQTEKFAILVEGYTDVIMMHQYGFKNCIATLGTSCTVEHLKSIAQYTDKMVIIYDSDSAGQNATMRIVELCWQLDLELYVVELPDKEDPASFLKNNNNLKDYLEKSQNIFSFFIEKMGLNFKEKSVSEKIKSIKKILDLISKVENKIRKEFLLNKVSETLNISRDSLESELSAKNNIKSIPIKAELNQLNNLPISKSKITQLEKRIFSVIILPEVFISEFDKEFLKNWLSKPLVNIFCKIEQFVKENNGLNHYLDCLSQEEKMFVNKISLESCTDKSSLGILLEQFYKKYWKLAINKTRSCVDIALKEGDSTLANKLLADMEILKSKILNRGIDEKGR